ncbi:hypothetical protein [Kitasatospora sp. A2-31]|uniref:hypothetical protein n=1 Tax=Kitasatospora sp. A2-31 TaxID=2916414 RepID=UPI001EEC8A11|nr:hypothetical protein [Kitasatospora sp. A2-31]MCG6494436.1 hypothetical protein [Kitasatospora sp. A2-31]MCG6500075.1 hypothetical protein [Kitasatospora sp. A2-31]
MRNAEPVAQGAAHAVRLLPVLTCRRHIDLLRVSSSMAPAVRRPEGGRGPVAVLG